MVSGIISYSLPRIMTSVYVCGRPSSLPLQMSADIEKHECPSIRSNRFLNYLHVSFCLLESVHVKDSCFMSLSLLAQWSSFFVAFPHLRKRWLSFQTSVNTVHLDYTQSLCLSWRWRFPKARRWLQDDGRNFKLFYPIMKLDSFWT